MLRHSALRPRCSDAARLSHASRPRSAGLVVQAAKKAEKKGGKAAPKQSALAGLLKKKEQAEGELKIVPSTANRAAPVQYASPEAKMLVFQMCDSYWRFTKKYLIEGADFEALAAAAYRAPFVLLAHNRFQEGVTDPLFTYANRAALELWETTWDDMIGTPSRLSAPDAAPTQAERQELLDRAAVKGVVTNYEGWRVSAKGKRFKIRDVVLFNIVDRQGTKLGQAAVFSRYELESGLVVQVTAAPSGEEDVEEVGVGIPTPEEMAAAEAAVVEQAAHVRALKEVQGLTNQDIPVQVAVLELKERKEHLVKLQRRLEDALMASRAAFDDDDDE